MISQNIFKTLGLVAVAALFTACTTPTEDTDTAVDVETPVVETGDTVDVSAVEAARKAEEEKRKAEAAAKAAQINAIEKVVYFAFDRSTLSAETKALLNKHAALLGETNVMVRLEGHADELGTREYNMALGERRAKAVANYLVSLGVPAVRIETISYGEEKPAVLGSGEGVRSKNRRVEVVYK